MNEKMLEIARAPERIHISTSLHPTRAYTRWLGLTILRAILMTFYVEQERVVLKRGDPKLGCSKPLLSPGPLLPALVLVETVL